MKAAKINLLLSRDSESWPDEAILLALCEKVVEKASKELALQANAETELSLVFTDDGEIQSLNAQWRGKDKPTNVLSFPAFPIKSGDPLPVMLGDVILACETVMREAQEEDKPLQNHIAHLVLHGFLHLLGYDHETVADAEIMEGLERQVLATLAIPDPYTVIDEPS